MASKSLYNSKVYSIFNPTVGLKFWAILVSENADFPSLSRLHCPDEEDGEGKGRGEEVPSQWCYAHRPQD